MQTKIAVVIPCYWVKKHILQVISQIPSQVHTIYVIDDKCPENVGNYVENNCPDPRVKVIFHTINHRVGGAVISGARQAIADGATIGVKIDGDGQIEQVEKLHQVVC